jgi:hypothetical protein
MFASEKHSSFLTQQKEEFFNINSWALQYKYYRLIMSEKWTDYVVSKCVCPSQ